MNQDSKMNTSAECTSSRDYQKRDKAFMKMIMPSILGIFLCMCCLVSLTWAWFSEDSETVSSIEAASYNATVSITDNKNEDAVVAANALKAGGEYTVKITTNATDNTVGYCVITAGSTTLVTSKAGATFTLAVDEDLVLTAEAFWGTPKSTYGEEMNVVMSGGNYRIQNGEFGEETESDDTAEKTSESVESGAKESEKSGTEESTESVTEKLEESTTATQE